MTLITVSPGRPGITRISVAPGRNSPGSQATRGSGPFWSPPTRYTDTRTPPGYTFVHGVDGATGDAPEEGGLAEAGDVVGAVDVRLGDDADPVADVRQNMADDGDADEGRVDVGVAGDEDDVELFPASLLHLCAGGGKEHDGLIVAQAGGGVK